MDPHDSKITTLVRVLLGAGLLYRGWADFGDPFTLAQALGLPFGTSLWLALGEFSLGLCLVVGILSRLCGLLALLGAAWLAVAAALSPALVVIMLAGLYLMLRGGGGYSTDQYIGRMQRRVAERERARQAAQMQSRE